MSITVVSCMKTDTHACTEDLAINLIFDMSHIVAKQHLLQAKYDTEKPATPKIILLFIYSHPKSFAGKGSKRKKNMTKSEGRT